MFGLKIVLGVLDTTRHIYSLEHTGLSFEPALLPGGINGPKKVSPATIYTNNLQEILTFYNLQTLIIQYVCTKLYVYT